ncbi:MAG: hypothetical protein GY822_29985 [Deltaproteobacteria bacterium]|nr:hypothetical protein [Deltaproteobacteria bacterium]
MRKLSKRHQKPPSAGFFDKGQVRVFFFVFLANEEIEFTYDRDQGQLYPIGIQWGPGAPSYKYKALIRQAPRPREGTMQNWVT